METLTYPYGETPEEVIRETQPDGLRHREFIAKRIEGLTVEQLDQYEDAVLGRAVLDLSYDDLLAVLDALLVASRAGIVTIGENDQEINPTDHSPYCECEPCRLDDSVSANLRISILAALGISES